MKRFKLGLLMAFCFLGAFTISSCTDLDDDTTPIELDEATDTSSTTTGVDEGGGDTGPTPPPPVV